MNDFSDNPVLTEVVQSTAKYIRALPLSYDEKEDLARFVIKQMKKIVKEAVKAAGEEFLSHISKTISNKEV